MTLETKTYPDGTTATGTAPLPDASPAILSTTLLPHQMRVVDEKTDLDNRLSKLKTFCLTPLFQSLPTEEKQRLTEQEMHMRNYSDVLGRRIAAF